MGMSSGVLDHLTRDRFMNDPSGRVAFFPFGSRRPGYYVDAPDESKIKPLVKMYAVAGALLNLVGSLSSYFLAQTQINDPSCSMTMRIERFAGVYSFCVLVLLILPALALWSIYKGAMADICSSLTAVGPESAREMKPTPGRHRTVLIMGSVGAFVLMLGVALVLLVSSRH
jgi:hypothetical protein